LLIFAASGRRTPPSRARLLQPGILASGSLREMARGRPMSYQL